MSNIDKVIIIESEKYRQAQERLLLDPIFTQLFVELGASRVQEAIDDDGSKFNHALRDEYRDRGGKVGVHGLGDYYKAAQLWVDSKIKSE